MESTKDTKPGGLQSTFSRRNFLKGAAALAAAASVPEAFGQQPTGAPSGTVWLYIGTYTGAPAIQRMADGKGIYLCELNLSTGKLTVLRLVAPALPATGTTASTASPSTIALDPDADAPVCRKRIRSARSRERVFDQPHNRRSDALECSYPPLALRLMSALTKMASIFSRPNTQAAGSKCSQFCQMGRSGLRCFSMQTLGNVDTSFTH